MITPFDAFISPPAACKRGLTRISAMAADAPEGLTVKSISKMFEIEPGSLIDPGAATTIAS